MSWSENCVIFEISRTAEVAANLPNTARRATETTGATFEIKTAKFYDLVVTLSINHNNKLLENIKQEFEKKFLGRNIDLK